MQKLGIGAYGIVWRRGQALKGDRRAEEDLRCLPAKADAQRTYREIVFLKEMDGHEHIIRLTNVLKADNDRDIYLVFECVACRAGVRRARPRARPMCRRSRRAAAPHPAAPRFPGPRGLVLRVNGPERAPLEPASASAPRAHLARARIRIGPASQSTSVPAPSRLWPIARAPPHDRYMETDLHAAIRANILQEIHKQYILWQSLKALKYMHSADLLHRDMKPSNLLLNSDCLMKVADFGLARSLHATGPQT